MASIGCQPDVFLMKEEVWFQKQQQEKRTIVSEAESAGISFLGLQWHSVSQQDILAF